MCLLLGPAVSRVWAQAAKPAPNFQGLPLDPSLAGNKRLVGDMEKRKFRVLKGQEPSGPEFERWYKQYFFPSFSQPTDLDQLPAKRETLRKDLAGASSKNVHKQITDWTLLYMRGMATTQRFNLHPAVRYNAMLMIGDLNAEERSFNVKVPKPLPQALDILAAEATGNASDAVRMAAMLGLLRHARLDWANTTRIPSAKRSAIAQNMLSLLNQTEPPAGRSPEGHVWMQRRAIEVLAALGLMGILPPVNQAVDQVLADGVAPVSLRCTAADAYGQMNMKTTNRPSVDPEDASRKLGGFAVYICQREVDRMEEQQKIDRVKKATSGGMGYGMGGSGYPGMEGSGYPGMEGSGYPGMDGSGYPGMPGGPGSPGMMPGMPGMEGGDYSEMEDGGYPGMMGGSGDGMYGMGTMKPKDPRLDEARRRLKYQLVCVQRGLDGITELAADQPQAASVKKVADLFAEVMKATDPEEPTIDALMKGVRTAARDLEDETGVLGPPIEEEEEEEIDGSPIPSAPGPAPAGVPGKPAAPGPDAGPAPPAAPGTGPAKPAAPGSTPPAPAAPGSVPGKPAPGSAPGEPAAPGNVPAKPAAPGNAAPPSIPAKP
jgi:hypothetical protein